VPGAADIGLLFVVFQYIVHRTINLQSGGTDLVPAGAPMHGIEAPRFILVRSRTAPGSSPARPRRRRAIPAGAPRAVVIRVITYSLYTEQ